MFDQVLKDNISSHISVFSNVNETIYNAFNCVVNHCVQCLEKGGSIYFCGNGGSASDAAHAAAELVGRFELERKGLKACCLSIDPVLLTAVANDYTFDSIFSRQIEARCQEHDLVFFLSTSGNSLNLLNAAQVCNRLGINTVALLGKGGGELSNLIVNNIIVPSNSTARIQEMHIFLLHTICGIIEKEFCREEY